MINPLPGIKELYFVADGTGRHMFSETYEEHLARIRQVRSKGEAPSSETSPGSSPDTSKTAARTDTAVGAVKKPAGPAGTDKPAAAAAKPTGTVGAKSPDTAAAKKSAAVTAMKPKSVAGKKPPAIAPAPITKPVARGNP